MVAAPDGTVYVNTWSGLYFGYDRRTRAVF